MHRFILPLCLLGLLLATFPAHAFFESLDEMERSLGNSSDPAPAPAGLDDLIEELAPAVEAPVIAGPLFTDIPSGAWFEQYVLDVATREIAEGYKDGDGNLTGYFGPGDAVTVAQILKIAMRAAGIDEAQCANAPDHPQARGHWAEQFVACGEQLGMRILAGHPALDRPARRAEVLSVIHDAFGDRVPSIPAYFDDTAGHAYENDIAYAAEQGIVAGDADESGAPTGRFRPDDGINRAEAAKIISIKMQLAVQ